jgi:hypothetical protein
LQTREREIFRNRLPTVSARDDVIDLVRFWHIVLMDATVLATTSRALIDQLTERCGNVDRHWS